MTAVNAIELRGHIASHLVAELAAEIAQERLDGSLRISREARKLVLYFRGGELVYCVSNAREHRLFAILLELGKLKTPQLAQFPNFQNDIELANDLSGASILSDEEIQRFIAVQQQRILIEVLGWTDGSWEFDTHARIRRDFEMPSDHKISLVNFARCMVTSAIPDRFMSFAETFALADDKEKPGLQKHETLLLEMFNGKPLSIDEMRSAYPLPESALFQALYVLWLGGLLTRGNWNAAFPKSVVDLIRNTRLSLVRPAAVPIKEFTAANLEAIDGEPESITSQPAETVEIALDEYLARVENAATFYDLLGVDAASKTDSIKSAYFSLVKQFHPDRFHKQENIDLKRIQAAFSALVRAYETLKDTESRKTYDFRIRKELELAEKRRKEGIADVSPTVDARAEQALDDFETGLAMLMDGEAEEATPYLARAAHYKPDNALYRAYYGKALSADRKQRHKAEAEMQAAAKLDPANPKIRIMLVELFIEMKMLKRAEGELNRFLEIAPNNTQARTMLKRFQSQPAE